MSARQFVIMIIKMKENMTKPERFGGTVLPRVAACAVSLFLLFLIPCAVYGQMTDEAVISYVRDGLAEGKSKEAIAKELAARGVTREQAERVNTTLTATYGSPTAVTQSTGVNRTRGAAPSEMTDSLSGTQPDNLARLSEEEVRVYGRDVFSNRNMTFAPRENIATPANYVLGPGDEVIVDIWGASQTTVRSVISPDGTVNIEGIGPVSLTGMTVSEADSYLRRRLGTIYPVDGEGAKSSTRLTLGSLRTVTVNVMGEVSAPGTYSLSSLSTVYHALYRAGGFGPLGSVRGVCLIRDGKRIAELDLYSFILDGHTGYDDLILQDGDLVSVPTYSTIVEVQGSVKRPMYYELIEGETLEDLLAYCGGFRGDAYTANVNVERQDGREYSLHTVSSEAFSSFVLRDGDRVAVGPVIDRYSNRVEVRGAVYRPGMYELGGKVKSVRELVSMAEGLMEDAYLGRALLFRERADRTVEVESIDLGSLMSGSIPDIPLRRNDILDISSILDIEDLGTVTIVGDVSNPGSFPFAANTTVQDLILQAGGLLESASLAKVEVSRRIRKQDSTEPSDTISRVFSFPIRDGLVVGGGKEFVLNPYDQVYVRRSPEYSPQRHIRVEGEVVFPGMYAMPVRGMRLTDAVKMAGGVSQWAYIHGARLDRVMNEEERSRLKAALEMVDAASDSLSMDKINQADRYSVGIDLTEAMARPGSDADIVLREGDVLTLPQYLSTVKVSGGVLYPNTVTYIEGMKVKDYVSKAGGYGFRAKKSRAYVIYLNGNVARAKSGSSAVVEPGCEIIVPDRKKREGSLQNILSIASTTASIATMLGTVYNIIK